MTNYCTIEQSLALKEIGFDVLTDYYYDNDGNLMPISLSVFPMDRLKAPTRSEVLQWAREKKGIDAWAMPTTIEGGIYFYVWQKDGRQEYSTQEYPTHPEAENALVWKIIEIIKEKKA